MTEQAGFGNKYWKDAVVVVTAGALIVLTVWGLYKAADVGRRIDEMAAEIEQLRVSLWPLRQARDLERIGEHDAAERQYKLAALDQTTYEAAVKELTGLYDGTDRPAEADTLVIESYRRNPALFWEFYLSRLTAVIGRSTDPAVQAKIVAGIPFELCEPVIEQITEPPGEPQVVALTCMTERSDVEVQEAAYRALREIGLAMSSPRRAARLAQEAADGYINARMRMAQVLYATDPSRGKAEVRRLIKLDPDNATLKDILKQWSRRPSPAP